MIDESLGLIASFEDLLDKVDPQNKPVSMEECEELGEIQTKTYKDLVARARIIGKLCKKLLAIHSGRSLP